MPSPNQQKGEFVVLKKIAIIALLLVVYLLSNESTNGLIVLAGNAFVSFSLVVITIQSIKKY